MQEVDEFGEPLEELEDQEPPERSDGIVVDVCGMCGQMAELCRCPY